MAVRDTADHHHSSILLKATRRRNSNKAAMDTVLLRRLNMVVINNNNNNISSLNKVMRRPINRLEYCAGALELLANPSIVILSATRLQRSTT